MNMCYVTREPVSRVGLPPRTSDDVVITIDLTHTYMYLTYLGKKKP